LPEIDTHGADTANRRVSAPDDGATLGIIGGAGVGAAARLYAEVAGRFRAAHGRLPQIVLWNAPFSDALEHAFVGGEPDGEEARIAQELVGAGVERLLDAGATVVAMPCNALQRIAAREAASRGAAFIDMIAATLEAVRATGERSAVLLSTEATRAAGIYEGQGVEILFPPAALRAELAAVIARAVEGPMPSAAQLRAVVAQARRPPVPVVLGCTDICGLLDGEDPIDGEVVDSLSCLAERCAEALSVRDRRA
jgi:aspartate racemase